MEAIWLWIGGVIVAVIPSIISGVFLHQMKKHEKEVEKRDEERAERERLCLENLNALSAAVKELHACVMHGRTPNGELEEAFNYMQHTKRNLEEYLRQLAAKK